MGFTGRRHSKATIEKMKLDGRRGRRHTLEARLKMSEWQKGLRHSPKSEFRPGIVPWNKGKGGYKLPDETKKKMSLARKGPNNPNWKGGKTPIHLAVRASLEYKLWRIAVFERDNYTCTDCGISGNQTGGYLEADHIKSFADYPELRLVLDNGRTLCSDCHSKTPNYKGRICSKTSRY